VESALSAFGIVFLAELGDKTMLFSLTAATRYRWWVVLLPICLAIALLNGIAVAVGGVAGELLPEQVIAALAAALFIAFGVWTLRSGGDDSDEETPAPTSQTTTLRVMLVLGAVFFLAELGDKTQIATLTLAGLPGSSVVMVWLGATLGMIAVNGLAVAAGVRLERLVPVNLVRIAAGIVFIGFGLAVLALAFL
jgi:putative Ca2+/H+ antiporter (TMEM165/GDT1 family)